MRRILSSLGPVLWMMALPMASKGAAERDPIPNPSAFFGVEVGEWHLRHDQLLAYYQTLAAASPRVRLEEYGRTYENRPLVVLAISSPENLARFDGIERWRRQWRAGDAAEGRPPLAVWLAYSVHGNESSGANAGPVVAHQLAAGRDPEILDWLEETVVFIDPSLNPDGLSRFAQWANAFRGARLVGDENHLEHAEGWPGGRGNHYWFDLNRDWLLLTHPESRGRVAWFQRWRPNVLADFHEMGSDSTYFFQPGAPIRQNPNTPARNLELTRRIARFHADVLDAAGRLYYTEERFDDFYYGKGSTYPDAQGSIGILFEQASSRGHLRETQHGELSFPFTIQNQISTSFSTLRAAHEMRDELLDYQRAFPKMALLEAGEEPVAGYLVDLEDDPVRARAFLDILARHEIEVAGLARDLVTDDGVFSTERCVAVPMDQPQYRLARSLFERRKAFDDVTFYDVSTWNLAYSFGYRMGDLPREALVGSSLPWEPLPPLDDLETEPLLPKAYAYAIDWGRYSAPKTLAALLRAQARVYVATQPFAALTPRGVQEFDYGTLVLPMGVQDADASTLSEILEAAQQAGGVVHPIQTGLTPQGVDLGSPSFETLEPMRVALVVGSGVSAYEAGEVWHLLDQRYDMAVSLVGTDRVPRIDWSEYTHMVLVSGAAAAFTGDSRDALDAWVRAGGRLIAVRGAVSLGTDLLGDLTEEEDAGLGTPRPDEISYAAFETLRDQDLVSGAIFQIDIDRSHPLGYGFARAQIPVFRNSEIRLRRHPDPFANAGVYSEEPWLCGYVSDRSLETLRGSASVVGKRLGGGSVVLLVDNPNFRGVWYGTNRLFANALFFSSILKPTRDLWDAKAKP